jgi:hypothetical protein
MEIPRTKNLKIEIILQKTKNKTKFSLDIEEKKKM